MPRTKTTTVTVYTFAELLDMEGTTTKGDKAAARAREWLLERAVDHDWWDYLINETWTRALEQIGFRNADIRFSGFWGQGDGASFTSGVDVEDLANFMATLILPGNQVIAVDARGKEDFRHWLVHKIDGKYTEPGFRRLAWLSDYIRASVERTDSRYSHENTCSFEAELCDSGELGPSPDYEWHSRQPLVRDLFDRWAHACEVLRRELCQAIYQDLDDEYEHLTSDEALAEMGDANDWVFDASGEWEGHVSDCDPEPRPKPPARAMRGARRCRPNAVDEDAAVR